MSRPSGYDVAQFTCDNDGFDEDQLTCDSDGIHEEQLTCNSDGLDAEPLTCKTDGIHEEQLTCNKPSVKILIDRQVYTQDKFHETFQISRDYGSGRPTKEVLRNFWHRQCCPAASKECIKLTALSFLPFIRIMKEYNFRHDLLSDFLAGLTVSFMHIPQGMAYALLANLDPVYGLYSSMFPVACYFFFGTSKHVSLGLFAIVSIMVGKAVSQSNCAELARITDEADNTTWRPPDAYSVSPSASTSSGTVDDYDRLMQCYVGVATAVTLMVGIYQIAFGLFKFGFITVYLSEPLTRAFTAAAALHVITSQLGLMFGVSVGQFSGPLTLVYNYITLCKNLPHTNVGSLVTCVVSMVIIYCVQKWISPKCVKKFKVPVPIELLVLVFGIVISYYGSFGERFNMKLVGVIPAGIPKPRVPPLSRLASVAGDAVGISILSFAMLISLAKLFAKKHKYEIDSNQEWIAIGISNIVGSMLNCFVSAPSMSRSAVQEGAGGKTQLASLVSCCVLLVTLLAVGPLFYHLPSCILSAVVIVNLRGMLLQVRDIPKLYRSTQYVDLAIWIVTAVSVVFLDVDLGLYVGIGFGVLTVMFRTQRPSTTLLGRIPETDIYRSLQIYNSATKVPDVHIFRFASSIHYANADYFAVQLYRLVGCNPNEIKRDIERNQLVIGQETRKTKLRRGSSVNPMGDDISIRSPQGLSSQEGTGEAKKQKMCDIRAIILDFSAVSFIDSDGVSMLTQVIQDYSDIGVRTLIACCQDDVYYKLDTAGVFKKYTTSIAFVEIHDAVLAAAEQIDTS